MQPSNYNKFSKAVMIVFLLVILNITMFKFMMTYLDENKSAMGGMLFYDDYKKLEVHSKGYVKPDDEYIERFLRPSTEKPIEKKYLFGKKESIPQVFTKASEVVRAYYDILSDAANIKENKGGCGSIGYERAPYPMAYDLLSKGFKENLSYEVFLKSFDGIGHINLLKLVEVPLVKIGEEVYPKFFVEIEAIEGSEVPGKTYFAYYQGFVTVEKEGLKGWKIKSIELKPEDFLCHAYHGWWHDGKAVVEIAYGKDAGVIEKVVGVEEDGYIKNVMALGKDKKQYRFVFIRLTNGADVELWQSVMVDGKWKDVYIEGKKIDK